MSICVGARVGQEVEALKRVGASHGLGRYPPLVIEGDFHKQPFDDETFDFEFSNVFDHALYLDKFVGEIKRSLRPGGLCVFALVRLLRRSDVVYVRNVDGFGLDTEVVFRKKK
ncbi:unnamed protein product [Cochlearia groenlandica]